MLKLSGFILLCFVTANNLQALDRIFPCKPIQCNDIPLLQAAVLKNAKNFAPNNFNMYFYDWSNEELINFSVVYSNKKPNSIGILGPFKVEKFQYNYLKTIYSFPEGLLYSLGINLPEEKRRTGVGGMLIFGYDAKYFMMHNWSIISLNSNRYIFGKPEWFNKIKKKITDAIILQGSFKNKLQLKEKLNSYFLNYQYAIKQLSQFQIFPVYNGLYFNSNSNPLTAYRTYYPDHIKIFMKDGMITFIWNSFLDDWVITKVFDLEGNSVTTRKNTGELELKIPSMISISKYNQKFWTNLFKSQNKYEMAKIISNLDFTNQDLYFIPSQLRRKSG